MKTLLRRPGDLVLNLILLAIAIPTFFPFFTMLSISLKTYFDYGQEPLWPRPPYVFSNYEAAWGFMNMTYFNNAVIIGTAVFCIMVFGSMTAFMLARFTFAGRRLLFFFVLAVLAIPPAVILVPQYMLIVSLDLLNTRWALILPYAAQQSFAILVLYTFYYNLPAEIFESASLDGAGYFAMYRHFALPLAKPVMLSIGVFLIWIFWNDYVWPSLVLSDPELQTAAVRLVVYTIGRNIPEPGQNMAASVISAIPLMGLFLITMRSFIAGLTSGAIKA